MNSGNPMEVGYGSADITPKRPMPLCGFAARCDKPFDNVDDQLFVHSLAMESHGQTVVLLVYDLLALGSEIHVELLDSLKKIKHHGVAPEFILCATHTHSAPAAIMLLGCGELQRDYRDLLISASREAAEAALNDMRPAHLRWTIVPLPDQNYNRRRILADGRVVMAREPDAPIRKTGPIWERMLLARFDDESDNGIAGIASWAAHAVTVCGLNVTADFPGELCRRLSEREKFPFLYLQGACGNLNPVFEEMTRKQMLANVDAIMGKISPIKWPRDADMVERNGFIQQTIPMNYGPLPTVNELQQLQTGMEIIARTGDGPPETMKILADILNVKPGTRLESGLARHIASIIRRWSSLAMPVAKAGRANSCQLETAALRFGKLVFCFVAAEVFVETAIRLQAAFPKDVVTLLSYKSPLIGYLPTDEALAEGGYEAAYAYRFYNHPAPFAKGSEDKLFSVLKASLFTPEHVIADLER